MFQLPKPPVVIVVSFLVNQAAWADDGKINPIEEALLNNATSYLGLPSNKQSPTNYPTQENSAVINSELASDNVKSALPHKDVSAALNANATEKIYPLGMSKQQYIARLQALENKRDNSASEYTADMQKKYNAVDELIARIESEQAEKRNQTLKQDIAGRHAPKRLINKQNRTNRENNSPEPTPPKATDTPAQKSFFSDWFKSNKDEQKNNKKGEQ